MPEVFPQLLSSLEKQMPLALAISVGDNVQLSKGPTDVQTVRDRYEGFLAAIAPLAHDLPFYSALGNHDEPDCAACLDAFRRYLPLPDQGHQTYYSFDYGPAHFVVLNSREGGGSIVHALSDAQFNWLQNDLVVTRQPVKFIFLHDSIFHVAKEEDQSFNQGEKDHLEKLFQDMHVTAVFAGHSHYYDYYERDGIAYVITGGAGSPLYEQYINSQWQRNEALVVDVNSARVSITALLPDGSTLDHRILNLKSLGEIQNGIRSNPENDP
jgi:predicted phosphodiesterase